MNYPKDLFFISRFSKTGFPMRLVEARPLAWVMTFAKPNIKVEDHRVFTSEAYVNESHLLLGAWVRPLNFDDRPEHLKVCIDEEVVIDTSLKGLKQGKCTLVKTESVGKKLFLGSKRQTLNGTPIGIICPNGSNVKISMKCPAGFVEVGLYLALYSTNGIKNFKIHGL